MSGFRSLQARTIQPNAKHRWWFEIGLVLAFYVVYSAVRNQFGSASVEASHAFDNAVRIIDMEKALGLYHEETIQTWFLDFERFMWSWNVFYGTFHFVVTIFAMVWVFKKRPDRYGHARSWLGSTTALALIGFATFPLMPPRLLPERFGYVDSLVEYGGLWSFDSGAMQAVSNQYAAMPSLHFGWSTWCALVLFPLLGSRWAKAAIAVYPALTLFAVIVTGNHYWLDAAGGAIVLALGYVVALAVTAGSDIARERLRKDPPSATAN